jgi:16S rRNA (uracil1498-N3)-methyltransferase
MESALQISLAQAVSRSDRMDYAIQKSVELGVRSIQPVITEHTAFSIREGKGEKKQVHWQGIVQSACEQCGRTYVPTVHPVRPFAEWVSQSGQDETGIKLVLDCDAEVTFSRLASNTAASPRKILLLIGPEGGLSSDELKRLQASGFVSIKLGPRVLRTETAAVAALAGLQTIWGDLA